MKITRYILWSVALIVSSIFVSCGDNGDTPVEPSPDIEVPLKTTVLLYAVASNNLYSNLIDDKAEILDAMSGMNTSGVSFLLYEVTRNGDPTLSEVVKGNDGSLEFKVIKEYDKSRYSTDPVRITEVINDMKEKKDSEKYGLILWSHGTGIDPSFSTHATRNGSGESSMEVSLPLMHSFGSDNDRDKDASVYDETDIDELADAIPGGIFNFIWFDACYMSGIETAYQLRNKCDFLVAYPTEVFTPGMPYNLTIPHILQEEPQLIEGSKAFFNYYAEYPSASMRVATIAVMDMSKINGLADVCERIYSSGKEVSAVGLQCYTRGKIGPFYDFGQVTRLKLEEEGSQTLIEEFDRALGEFVVYSAATPTDFNYKTIKPENFSGVSCYLYSPTLSTAKANYYRTLDWYLKVYPMEM